MSPTGTMERGRAYLVTPEQTASARWQDFVPEAWLKLLKPRIPVSLVGSLMMDRALEVDHAALAHAISRYPPAARHRLNAQHSEVIEAARQWPDLLAKSFDHVWQFFSGGQSFADTQRRLTRTREAASGLAEWAQALENSLNRKLIQRWPESDWAERTISRTEVITNFRPQKVVGVSSVADLPVVAESGEYVATTAVTTWLSSAPVIKHGLIDLISYEAARTDDIRAIGRRVDELVDAAHRTLARAIWSPWVLNSMYQPDTKSWFHADHGNLLSAALSAADVTTAVDKILAQTKPGSSETLGLSVRPGMFHLTIPPALWATAVQINQELGSPVYHLFGESNQFVHPVAVLGADQNNWGVHLDSRYIESVRVLVVDQEEPKIELADDAAKGSLFTHDQIAYKISFHFAVVAPVDYRGAVKAVVA